MAIQTEWTRWPIAWSAVWVGVLTGFAVGLLIGLLGFAFGAHESSRYVDWKEFRLITLIFSVAGAFFAGVAGGWTAARIAGFRRSEPAMLHGGIVWLVTLPLLLVLAALGGSVYLGSWYGGLSGLPAWAAGAVMTPEIAEAMRNNAVATVLALLLGLVGSAIGGWMASGEPMTFTHHRTRILVAESRVESPEL